MAATVYIVSVHVDGDTTTNIGGHMRFKLADNDTVDTNNPCRIPTDDQVAAEIPFTYSFIKYLKLFAHTGPTNSISNLRFFLDGNELGTGISLMGDTTASTHFRVPISADSTGDVTCHYAVVTGGDAWTKASPLVVNASTVWSAAETGDGGSDQKYVLLQTRIGNTATPGTYPAVDNQGVLSYRYDEN